MKAVGAAAVWCSLEQLAVVGRGAKNVVKPQKKEEQFFVRRGRVLGYFSKVSFNSAQIGRVYLVRQMCRNQAGESDVGAERRTFSTGSDVRHGFVGCGYLWAAPSRTCLAFNHDSRFWHACLVIEHHHRQKIEKLRN